MKKAICFLLVCILSSTLIGCATPMMIGLKNNSQRYVPSGDPAKGCIYVYRENNFMGWARGIYVTANGKRVGGLNSGTYFVYESEPGDVYMSVENWIGDDPSRKVHVEAGKKYYLRGFLKMGALDFMPYIERVNDLEGEEAVESLKYATLPAEERK